MTIYIINFRKNTTSHQATESSLGLCPSVPEERLDDSYSDASVDEGNLAETHKEAEEPSNSESLQRQSKFLQHNL